jgi:branched-chain amino acid transport system substrate-binding protein
MKQLMYGNILIGTILLVVGACGQESRVAPSGNVIKIGIIAPFSGTDLDKGGEGLKGVETVMRLWPLLANGDKIEIVKKDDGNEPARAVKALQELTEVDQVAAIVTFSGSGPVLAMAGAADRYKTPILATLATHPDITRRSEYVSQVCFDDIFQGQVAAAYVRDELLLDTVAVFRNTDSIYSSNLATEFERKFVSLGGRISDTVSLSAEAKDYTAVLKPLSAKGPELLYLPLKAEDVIGIIEAAAKLNWMPLMMAGDGILATVMARHREQADLLDGLLTTDFYHYTNKLTPFGEKVRHAYDGRATSFAILGVEGFAILCDAMNRCSEPASRECINDKIRTTSNFTGVMGPITIGSDGKAQRPLVINTIHKKRMVFMVKVY